MAIPGSYTVGELAEASGPLCWRVPFSFSEGNLAALWEPKHPGEDTGLAALNSSVTPQMNSILWPHTAYGDAPARALQWYEPYQHLLFLLLFSVVFWGVWFCFGSGFFSFLLCQVPGKHLDIVISNSADRFKPVVAPIFHVFL